MKDEIIVIEQLPVITQRLQMIKEEVTEKVARATSLVCTADTVKEIKVVRANLTKDFKDFEERRKAVKKAVMTPYDEFEAVYRECVSDTFKKADQELKNKIDSVENELKENKAEEVKAYFYEYRKSKGIDFISFENANINVTLSASLKGLKEQAKAFVDRIVDDLVLIDTQDHKEEILYEYKNHLNVSAAITTVVNRYIAIEEQKAKEEERKAMERAEEAATEKVTDALTLSKEQPIAPPAEKEPRLTLKFTVRATRSKLKELKEFLEKGGYDYE